MGAGALLVLKGRAVGVIGNRNWREEASSSELFGKLAERGMDVDAGAVRAVSGGAVSVVGYMNSQKVANSLGAFGKLAERGMDVDAGAVRAVSGRSEERGVGKERRSRWTPQQAIRKLGGGGAGPGSGAAAAGGGRWAAGQGGHNAQRRENS